MEVIEQIISAFPHDRFEVTSAFLQGRPESGQPRSCAEHVHYFGLPKKSMRGLRIGLHRALWRYCRQSRFDVIICDRYKSVSALMTINRFLPLPLCIGISHALGEYDSAWRHHFAAFSIRSNWRFVGVSPTVRDYLINLGCGFTPENTVAIANALDLKVVEDMFLPRAAAREELGLPQKARLIGAIGRLVPVKGHIYLIRAFAAIASRHPDAHLAIIGDGREETRLREAIQQYGLADRIHLLGWRTRAKRYVRAFDIWAMPSLKEGLGLALLEGMCGQLPIIASDVPAMRPLIEGAGGLAVPPANVDALAEALEHDLRLDDETLQEKGRQAYAYVRDHMTIEQYRSAWLQLVEQGLADRNR
jgi:glycosyltransferase involved in cell wall biosynthesis